MMERRERDLLTQLRAATTASSLDVTGGGAGGSLPVSQILGDLKEKQEQLFLQYMGKLKAGGGRAAMGGVMADQLLAARPVAANASIKYVKTANTDITAIATASIPAEVALKAFHADGKVVFDVHVDIRDADENTCAEMTVAWHIKKTG